MIVCPCKDCPHKGCGTFHSECKKYLAWKVEMSENNKKLKKLREKYHFNPNRYR